MSDELRQVNESYIVESLRDGIAVLGKMMEVLAPDKYLTLAEINEYFPEYTGNKIYRIIMTCYSLGWIDKHPSRKAYRVGDPLLYLSHRYMKKLYREHEKITHEVGKFRLLT